MPSSPKHPLSSTYRPFTLVAACALMACVTPGTGKNPCGLIGSANDPFQGPVRGFALYLDSGHYLAIGAASAKGNTKLNVMVVARGVTDDMAHAGDRVEFALGDTVVSLANAKDIKPVANQNGYQAFTQWMLELPLSPSDMTQFSQARIKAFKATIGSQTFQVPLTEEQGEQVKNSIACLMQ